MLVVSGGVDSIVLTDLAAKCSFDFVIAHCNFQLRGEESSRDETFVRALENKYGKKVLVKKFATENYAAENKISIQEAASELRYDWFNQLIVDNGQWTVHNKKHSTFNTQYSIFLATAHHANDNIETLLINFFRGTGIGGLHGIPPKQGKIIRPLLFAKRQEILVYAKENNLQWVEDSSNTSSKYTRNFFRNELLPAIKKVFPQTEENLLDNIYRFKKANALYQTAIEELKKKLCEPYASEVRIPVLKLMKYQHTSLIYEIIKDFGFGEKQVEELVKLASAGSGNRRLGQTGCRLCVCAAEKVDHARHNLALQMMSHRTTSGRPQPGRRVRCPASPPS